MEDQNGNIENNMSFILVSEEPVPEDTEYMYRYEELRNELRLILNYYAVVKKTPCGVWIKEVYKPKKGHASFEYFSRKRWVNLSSRKKFACATKEEAMESFKARKRRQIRILNAQLGDARRALNLANRPETDREILGG